MFDFLNLHVQAAAPIVKEGEPNQLADLEPLFGNIVGAILPFVSVLLFFLLVFGGFKYITAGSDPRKIEGAKNTLTYAIVGMVLLALAFLILVLIEEFTDLPVTQFRIIYFPSS